MGINGIGTVGYPVAEYGRKNKESKVSQSQFSDTIAEKAVQEKPIDYNESAFASVGAKAPAKVKQAWMEAAKETDANGLGISENGMMTHISQLMVQRVENQMNGVGGTNDLLGSTVQSAIRVIEQALYDLDHPLTPEKSVEIQRYRVKERAFYKAFLEKLRAFL